VRVRSQCSPLLIAVGWAGCRGRPTNRTIKWAHGVSKGVGGLGPACTSLRGTWHGLSPSLPRTVGDRTKGALPLGRATTVALLTSRGCPDAVCCEDSHHPQLPVVRRRLQPPPEREPLGEVTMLGHRGYTQRKHHLWWGITRRQACRSTDGHAPAGPPAWLLLAHRDLNVHPVAPGASGLELWCNVHRPHGSGSPSARTQRHSRAGPDGGSRYGQHVPGLPVRMYGDFGPGTAGRSTHAVSEKSPADCSCYA
jgi:hypothetical protein